MKKIVSTPSCWKERAIISSPRKVPIAVIPPCYVPPCWSSRAALLSSACRSRIRNLAGNIAGAEEGRFHFRDCHQLPRLAVAPERVTCAYPFKHGTVGFVTGHVG